jgi:tRNA dimethylallyltransferase
MSERLLEPARGVRPRIILVVGPTAAGKSALALQLAQALDGEVVSADSVQVYRGMDIGTAKPTREERERIPHHLLDLVDPDQPFNVARFKELADQAIADVVARGRTVIVAGGTGLYLKVLLHGIFPAPPVDEELRRRYYRESEVYGTGYLFERLNLVDPEAAQRIAPTDLIRIVRALEVFEQTGIPLSEHQLAHSFHGKDYEGLVLGLSHRRDVLYRRVELRVEQMMQAGFLAEVEGLLARGYGPELKPMQSLGYKQLAEAILGRVGLEDAVRKTKRESKRYAKRQLTWFRSDRAVEWLDPPLDLPVVIERCRAFLRRSPGA